MPKSLPTDKAALKLILRRIAENKEGFNQSQLCLMLQATDRWAKVIGLYDDVPLTSPTTPYTRNPIGLSGSKEEEPENPYTPTTSVEDVFRKIIPGGDNATATDKSS